MGRKGYYQAGRKRKKIFPPIYWMHFSLHCYVLRFGDTLWRSGRGRKCVLGDTLWRSGWGRKCVLSIYLKCAAALLWAPVITCSPWEQKQKSPSTRRNWPLKVLQVHILEKLLKIYFRHRCRWQEEYKDEESFWNWKELTNTSTDVLVSESTEYACGYLYTLMRFSKVSNGGILPRKVRAEGLVLRMNRHNKMLKKMVVTVLLKSWVHENLTGG